MKLYEDLNEKKNFFVSFKLIGLAFNDLFNCNILSFFYKNNFYTGMPRLIAQGYENITKI